MSELGKEHIYFQVSALSTAAETTPGISISFYILPVSIQNMKKTARTKEVEIKNLIRASANGNNKSAVKSSNLEIIYREIISFSYFHTYIHIHVPVLHMTYGEKLSRELHVWGH